MCTVSPDGVRHEFLHDTELRLTQVTNPQGLTWNYTYDAAGRLISESDFDDRVLAYTHDLAGQLTPRTMRFTYDTLGRRTSRTTPTGHTTTYTYDAAGNRTAMDIAGHVLTFDHDAAGQELTRTIGDNLQLAHTWDPTGRLSTQSLTTAGTGTVPAPTGTLPSPNPAAEATGLLHRGYIYRPDGHLTAIDDALTGRHTFALDRAGRITAVHASDWTETYAYDAAGNQTHATWPDCHASPSARGGRSYEGTRITRAGRIRYEHDHLGRVTLRQKTRLSRKPDSWHYAWDAEDRLTTVTTPDGTTWRYLYDSFARRIAKQRLAADSATVVEQTDFIWDGVTLTEQSTHTPGAPEVVTLTWDHQGLTPLTQTERKTRSPDLAFASQEAIDQRFFAIITDLVGTPTELVSEVGEIAWQAQVTIRKETTWNSDATAYTPIRFPGQYFDQESQLHFNFHRHYEPGTARFLSPDPLGLKPARNPATYVTNPHSWVAPYGLSVCPRIPDDEIPVIGSLPDTGVAIGWPGRHVLDVPDWSPKINDAWVESIVRDKRTVYIESPQTPETLIHPEYGQTVFARELEQLKKAGYRQVGDCMIPPGG